MAQFTPGGHLLVSMPYDGILTGWDPNVRAKGDGSRMLLEQCPTDITVGQTFVLWEDESELHVRAVVSEVNYQRRLVYFDVDWSAIYFSEDD